MPLSMASRFSMVAPLVSKSKSDGRWSESWSVKRSEPASASRITSAAMTNLVRLAIANCEPTSTGCTPSAVPAAPDHTPPSAEITVAVMPGSPPSTAASRMACRAAAVSSESGLVGTSGKCPRLYAPSTGDDVGIELTTVGLGPPGEREGSGVCDRRGAPTGEQPHGNERHWDSPPPGRDHRDRTKPSLLCWLRLPIAPVSSRDEQLKV